MRSSFDDRKEVWQLRAGGKAAVSIVSCDLAYFRDHFVGRSMAESWVPPRFELTHKSGRPKDFISWELTVPVVSARAKQCLAELCAGSVEFLPLGQIKGADYFAINVLAVLDVLDEQRSDADYFSGKMVALRKAEFRVLPPGIPPIFKVPQWSSVYVRRPFAETVVANKLTGAIFADPHLDNFRQIVKGDSINVFPGVD